MNKGDRMSKEKRNIATKLETESKYLTNILDKDDVKNFKKLIPELQDTWMKKQMFRTETEMRFSVLSDNKYPTKAAKYWQSVREQNTHFENLMHLSFDARKNDVEIENTDKKIKKYVPLSKRQDKPDSALWLIKQHNILKDSQIAKLVGVTKSSVTAIRNKSYWNFNNLNAKDPVAMGLFSQKELMEAIEKAERRIKREKKEKERAQNIK